MGIANFFGSPLLYILRVEEKLKQSKDLVSVSFRALYFIRVHDVDTSLTATMLSLLSVVDVFHIPASQSRSCLRPVGSHVPILSPFAALPLFPSLRIVTVDMQI
jgi:hypothetical protein